MFPVWQQSLLSQMDNRLYDLLKLELILTVARSGPSFQTMARPEKGRRIGVVIDLIHLLISTPVFVLSVRCREKITDRCIRSMVSKI